MLTTVNCDVKTSVYVTYRGKQIDQLIHEISDICHETLESIDTSKCSAEGGALCKILDLLED